MVPVELTLSNFLSYGADPQKLDFTQFHVACLSGKNGQGKSALLDAITWVLWGEARKSSGGHKPDEELLRIGTRRMKVELVFEVEGVRYRVMRAYSRSATGKTSKAEMEVQVLDSDTDEGRPITQASIRESQAQLNDILGLDYHTFINSAFLLQGRSDEFTKKKPSERKDILGRILNLEKYDRLANMARERQRKLGDSIDQSNREIERLTLALEHEPETKLRFEDVTKQVAQVQNELGETREKEASFVEQLGAFEANQKAADTIKASISQLQGQARLQNEEKDRLLGRIERAKALVARKNEVEERYERFNLLVEEREKLDASREVHRGIERQLEQKKNELAAIRNDLDQKIRQLEFEQKTNKETLADVETKLASKERLELELAGAKEAEKRVAGAVAQIQVRDKIKEQIAGLESLINGRREALTSQVNGFAERQAHLKTVLEEKNKVTAENEELKIKTQQLEQSAGQLERLTQEGQQAGEQIKALEGEIKALDLEKEKLKKQIEQLEDVDSAICPTCGNDLTPEHRVSVTEKVTMQISEIEQRIKANLGSVDKIGEDRDVMRQKFRALRAEVDSLEKLTQRMVQLEERLRNLSSHELEFQDVQRKLKEAQATLSEKSYAADQYAELEKLTEKLRALQSVDSSLEADRFKANQVARYEDNLREILHAEGRKEALTTQLALQKEQVVQLRSKVESGDNVVRVREEIDALTLQLKNSGFNGGRFESVRVEIKELGNAQSEYKDLLNAEQSMLEWGEQIERIEPQLIKIGSELQELQKQLEKLQVGLQGKETLEEQLKQVAGIRSELEQQAQVLQTQSGELTARLDQAKQDRAALKERRAQLKDLKAEEGIYSKLRRAFSKQGIPSLIIEQALPEIEERTNELLARLADGKMRVTLETLKDKKTGGTKETLEIVITDEQGVPRPYETFSGGEAFRVNFAIRIALSQMLADRSGVRVRTLGIDEGFGTQDQEGIQNLIEALQIIQEDFDKIIVITHLDRLKEAFPVRIEVEKHPVEGSRFTLIQN